MWNKHWWRQRRRGRTYGYGGTVKNGQELEDCVLKIATVTLLSLWATEGTRQDLYLAAAGYLGRYLDHEVVEEILEVTVEVTGDEEPEKRSRAVSDTFMKLEKGENATGGPTLEDLALGVPKLLAKWWGWKIRDRKNGGRNQVPTNDELRDRWIKQYPNTAFGLGEWRRCDNGIWGPMMGDAIRQEISEVLEKAKPEGIRPTSHLIKSVEQMSKFKRVVPDKIWDSNEDILVCSNGTLEISSRTLREHQPQDYALSSVPFAYDPSASAPSWAYFLRSTVPEAAEFLQEFAGYCLTVDTSHELAVWLHGERGTGKSTFIEGLKAMLGERAGVLGLADIIRNKFALANLPGKTLMVATEQPSDYLKSTDILNTIISGEELPVERKFKDPFSITPRAKICWAMNDLPRVGDANSGLFRRVKVVTFPKLQGDPDIKLKGKIESEASGILNWGLEGLRRVKERGHFKVPFCVRVATEEFQQTNDIPALFVGEACILSEEDKVQASKLYEAYKAWCRINGHKSLTATNIANDWKRFGFEKKKTRGRNFYRGLKLNPEWVTEHELGWELNKTLPQHQELVEETVRSESKLQAIEW